MLRKLAYIIPYAQPLTRNSTKRWGIEWRVTAYNFVREYVLEMLQPAYPGRIYTEVIQAPGAIPRSRLRNDLALRALDEGCDALLFLDADTLIPGDWLLEAEQALANGHQWVQTADIWRMMPESSQMLIEVYHRTRFLPWDDKAWVARMEQWRKGVAAREVTRRLKNIWRYDTSGITSPGNFALAQTHDCCGVATLMTAQAFKAIRGYDERFTGWGSEDTAALKALETLCGRGYRGKTTGYHLYHPSSDREQYPALVLQNRALYRRYYRAGISRFTMQRLVKEAGHGPDFSVASV